MINIIVNKGYAEDAMAAARKAGAGGGTVVLGRGTAKEGDEKFFGVEIVPEKEMLVILAEQSKAEAVVEAIQNLECFSKGGSGVAGPAPAHPPRLQYGTSAPPLFPSAAGGASCQVLLSVNTIINIIADFTKKTR